MRQDDDGLAPATSQPNIKIVLMTNSEIAQVLKEWDTAYWPGLPDDFYEIDGDTWETKSFHERPGADGTIVYEVRVARTAPTA